MNKLQILVFIEFLESVPTFMEIRFVFLFSFSLEASLVVWVPMSCLYPMQELCSHLVN